MNADVPDARLQQLLQLVHAHPGISAARACKQLALSRSELQRLLLVLGDDSVMQGLGLIRIESDPAPARLWLTAVAAAPDPVA